MTVQHRHFSPHVSLPGTYAFSLPTHYFSCTRFLRFLPHPRCMGPLSALCRWKVRGEAANRVETKGFFLLRLTHWSNLKDSCSPPGCPKLFDLISPLSVPSTMLVADLWKYQKGMERAHQGGTENRRHVLPGHSSCLLSPLLLCPPPPFQFR